MNRCGRSRRRVGRLAALALSAFALSATLACEQRPEPKPARASFGVVFGGQIQERPEIPLVLDRARQSLGIRVEFSDPPTLPHEIAWELEKPGSGKDGGPGVVAYGTVKARPGEAVLDIPLSFKPEDRVGNWRVKVTLGEQTLLDRAFRVVAPTAPPVAED